MIVGMESLTAKLGKLSTMLQGNSLVRVVEAAGDVIRDAARAKAPGTGQTFAPTIKTEAYSTSAISATAIVGSNHPGARIQELGGLITPNKAKMLHFVIGGQDVFAKAVHIPARPYLRPAFDEKKNAAADMAVVTAIRLIMQQVY